MRKKLICVYALQMDKCDFLPFMKVTIMEYQLNSIAIRCAMIIADQFSERRKVADNLKRLYGIRSAIAHGGEKNVSNKDCEQLFGYIVYLINDLAHKKPWKEYSSMKDIVLEIDDRQLGK